MKEWTSRFETDHRAALSDDLVDELLDQLDGFHAALGATQRGELAVTISYPAEDLRQALVTGEAVVRGALAAAHIDGKVTAAEVMTSEQFDRQLGLQPLPELLSVTEAAAIIGVTGARVRQMLDAGQLEGAKAGATWVVPRAAAEARRPAPSEVHTYR